MKTKEEIAERKKEYYKRWKEKNKESIAKKKAEDYLRNKDKYSEIAKY